MTYQDKYTFFHDKPCINGEPSSNNRMIYTAYSKYLAPEAYVNNDQRYMEIENCYVSALPMKVNRLPGKPYPVFSKDELIGLASLGYLDLYALEKSHWNFCNLPDYEPKKLTLPRIFRAVKSLWRIRKEHRNYFWKNKMEETYCLAFWVKPWDKYYIKRFKKVKPNLLERVAFYINAINVLTRGDKSSRMILWLQCEDMEHWLLRFINKKKWVKTYFESEHPFVRNLEK